MFCTLTPSAMMSNTAIARPASPAQASDVAPPPTPAPPSPAERVDPANALSADCAARDDTRKTSRKIVKHRRRGETYRGATLPLDASPRRMALTPFDYRIRMTFSRATTASGRSALGLLRNERVNAGALGPWNARW